MSREADVVAVVMQLAGFGLVLLGGLIQYQCVEAFGPEVANKILVTELGVIGLLLCIQIASEQNQVQVVGRE